MEQKSAPTGIQTAYSPDGYIVDQARVTDVRYGWRASSRNGCGWIAVFNFLKCMDDPVPYGEVAAALARHSLFRGLLGTSPLRVRRYLKRRGYALESALGRGKAVRSADCARAGILVYRHSGGWHFVAFARRESGLLRFYNAVAGASEFDRTMEAFLLEQNRARVVWLLYLPEAETGRDGDEKPAGLFHGGNCI